MNIMNVTIAEGRWNIMHVHNKFDKIFFKLIKEYNKKEEFYDHYVKIEENKVMVIYQNKHSWHYSVNQLEKFLGAKYV